MSGDHHRGAGLTALAVGDIHRERGGQDDAEDTTVRAGNVGPLAVLVDRDDRTVGQHLRRRTAVAGDAVMQGVTVGIIGADIAGRDTRPAHHGHQIDRIHRRGGIGLGHHRHLGDGDRLAVDRAHNRERVGLVPTRRGRRIRIRAIGIDRHSALGRTTAQAVGHQALLTGRQPQPTGHGAITVDHLGNRDIELMGVDRDQRAGLTTLTVGDIDREAGQRDRRDQATKVTTVQTRDVMPLTVGIHGHDRTVGQHLRRRTTGPINTEMQGVPVGIRSIHRARGNTRTTEHRVPTDHRSRRSRILLRHHRHLSNGDRLAVDRAHDRERVGLIPTRRRGRIRIRAIGIDRHSALGRTTAHAISHQPLLSSSQRQPTGHRPITARLRHRDAEVVGVDSDERAGLTALAIGDVDREGGQRDGAEHRVSAVEARDVVPVAVLVDRHDRTVGQHLRRAATGAVDAVMQGVTVLVRGVHRPRGDTGAANHGVAADERGGGRDVRLGDDLDGRNRDRLAVDRAHNRERVGLVPTRRGRRIRIRAIGIDRHSALGRTTAQAVGQQAGVGVVADLQSALDHTVDVGRDHRIDIQVGG